MLEGYGFPCPIIGMVTGLEFVNEAVPGGEGLTVNKNDLVAIVGPSLTVTVIVAVPVCPAEGVTVTVRLDAEPPKAIEFSGTREGLDELADNCRFIGAISRSPTVKVIGPAG
jgi:hypothetical protein